MVVAGLACLGSPSPEGRFNARKKATSQGARQNLPLRRIKPLSRKIRLQVNVPKSGFAPILISQVYDSQPKGSTIRKFDSRVKSLMNDSFLDSFFWLRKNNCQPIHLS
jgi:hypothetical protein